MRLSLSILSLAAAVAVPAAVSAAQWNFTANSTLYNVDDAFAPDVVEAFVGLTGTTPATVGTEVSTFVAFGPWDGEFSAGSRLLGTAGSTNSIDIIANTPNTNRTRIEFSWSTGDELLNEPGPDFFIFENGGIGSPEAYSVAVVPASTGTPTATYYEFADDYNVENAAQAFVTLFDLSDFGVAEGTSVNRIIVYSNTNVAASGPLFEDRVDSVTGEGVVTFNAGGGSGFSLRYPPEPVSSSTNAGNTFPNGALDADITYLGVLSALAGSNVADWTVY